MTPTDDPRLSDAAYALLGLLSFGERSGYDLIKLADESIASFFKVPSKAQVYAELRRFTELGYAREREVVQRSRPNKRLYRITHSGERALRRWLEHADPVPFGGLFLVQLMFGRYLDPDVAIRRFEAMKQLAVDERDRLQGHEQRLRGSDEHVFPHLLIEGRLAQLDACIAWADAAVGRLRKRRGRNPARSE